MSENLLARLPIFAPVTTKSAPEAPAPSTQDHKTTVDWNQVRELRTLVAKEHSRLLEQGDESDMSTVIRAVVKAHTEAELELKGRSVSTEQQDLLLRAVRDAVLGLGRLQPLLDDDSVENIELHGCDRVVVEYQGGALRQVDPVAESDEELIDDLNFLAASTGVNAREFSTAQPLLDMRLPDGSRLAASMAISPRPQVTVRRHRLRRVSLADLVARRMMSEQAAAFLSAAVRAQKTIMVAGPQGAGKTTLLRALCGEMDPWESVGTIETEHELHLHELTDQHYRVRAWEARTGSGEERPDGSRAGEITLDRLTESAWRHNLDRLILGEVRGREAAALMKVISGVQGAMWTIHAPSARQAVDRMVTLMLEAGPHVTVEFARRQVNAHVDLVVQVSASVSHNRAGRSRSRYVSEIAAIEEGEAGSVGFTDVFSADPGEQLAKPRYAPPPRLLSDLRPFLEDTPRDSTPMRSPQWH